MNLSEITKKIPKAEIPKSDELGFSKFTLSFFPLPDRYTSYGQDETPNSIDTDKFTDFKGWQTVTLELIDNKVVSIEIQYDSSIKWKNLMEFIGQFSVSFNLPSSWQSDTTSESKFNQSNFIVCNNFKIEARMRGQTNPIIFFFDLNAPKIFKQRKFALEERGKKGFKPK